MIGKINRNNYPVWITDYHDGNLDSHRLEELFSFLSANPDLMEEFEEYNHNPLHPVLTTMPGGKDLRKNFYELSSSQQEEITAAMAEGDITGANAEETMRHISASPYLSDLYNRLKVIRLKPGNIVFTSKKSLKHYPLRLRFKRIAIAGLATAASIAILLSISLLFNRDKPLSEPLAGSAETDAAVIALTNRDTGETTTGKLTTDIEKKEISSNHDTGEPQDAGEPLDNGNPPDNGNPALSKIAEAVKTDNETNDRPTRKIQNIKPITHIASPLLIVETVPSARLAQMAPVEITDYYNYSSPREFIAKNFREIILGKENATTERLKPIELADATVTGINKLLGWEMKLEKGSDENGTLNSVSFSSQLINFDHNLKTRQ